MRNLVTSAHRHGQISVDDADVAVCMCVNDEQEQLFVAFASGRLALFPSRAVGTHFVCPYHAAHMLRCRQGLLCLCAPPTLPWTRRGGGEDQLIRHRHTCAGSGAGVPGAAGQ